MYGTTAVLFLGEDSPVYKNQQDALLPGSKTAGLFLWRQRRKTLVQREFRLFFRSLCFGTLRLGAIDI